MLKHNAKGLNNGQSAAEPYSYGRFNDYPMDGVAKANSKTSRTDEDIV